jgi:hypothetical protein
MNRLTIASIIIIFIAFIACQKEPSTAPTINRSPTGDLIAKMTYSDSNNNALLEQRFIYDANAKLKVIRTREIFGAPNLREMFVDSFFRDSNGKLIGHSGRLVDSTTMLGNEIDNIVHTVFYLPNSNNINYTIAYRFVGRPLNEQGKDSVKFIYTLDGKVKETITYSGRGFQALSIYQKSEYLYDVTGNTVSIKKYNADPLTGVFTLQTEETYAQFDANRKYFDDFTFLESFLKRRFFFHFINKNMFTKFDLVDNQFGITRNYLLQNFYNANNRPDSSFISSANGSFAPIKLKCIYQ